MLKYIHMNSTNYGENGYRHDLEFLIILDELHVFVAYKKRVLSKKYP